MTRRSPPEDPLRPRSAVTWLVVRNQHSQLVEGVELAPNVDLRKVLAAERDARIATGWDADSIGARCSFFFCRKGGVRLFVGIQVIQPEGLYTEVSSRPTD
jgi:hypothetical protein